jgi:hypothetical protein
MKGCDSYLWDFYSQVYIAFSVVISIFFSHVFSDFYWI